MKAAGQAPETLLGQLASLPDRERLGCLRDHGRAEELIIALADEVERLTFADVARALTMSEMLVALADELGVARSRSRTRRARAQALAYAGRLEAALSAADEAVAIAEPAGEAIEAARARLASLHPLGELGRYDDAVAAGESAAATFRAAGEQLLAAKADINLGGIHQNRDDPHQALLHLNRAREALHDQPMLTGFVENNRGEALLSLHDFAAAQAAFEAALQASEKAGAELAAAISEGNLGDLAARRGSLPRAMLHFERARRRLESNAAPSHLARLIAEHAEALELLGLPDDAMALYQEALPRLEEHHMAWEAARAQAGMGRAWLHLGDLERSEAALRRAAMEFQRLKHDVERARAETVLAEVATRRGDLAAAAELLSAAEGALRDKPADLAGLRLSRARVAFLQNRWADAELDVERGLQFATELAASPLVADLLHLRGRLADAAGDAGAALRDYKSAVAEVERVRGAFQAQRFRTAFQSNRLAIYDDLTRALLDAPKPNLPAAFENVEAAKARRLLDGVQGALESVPAPTALSAAELQLHQRISQLRAELSVLYSQLAESGGARLAGWTQAVRQRERELPLLEARLASANWGGIGAPSCTLEQLQAALPPGVLLVEYHAVGEQLAAFAVTCTAVRLVRDLVRTAELPVRLDRLRFQLARAMRPGALTGPRRQGLMDDTQRELRDLWTLLLAPFAEVLDSAERIVFVPHGALHALPLHALFDGQRYTLDRAPVSYVPSASILLHLLRREDRSRSGSGVLVVGVPDEAAPQMSREAERLAASLPGATLLLGGEATVARVCANVESARIVHLACHGRFLRRHPWASGLKLADRWLTLHEVNQLRLSADLVTLSGCETGRGQVERGDDLSGLVSSFLTAGARSLMVSQWQVNDDCAVEFMSGIYRACYNSITEPGWGSRLRDQQLVSRQQCAHPLLWAPFIWVGMP